MISLTSAENNKVLFDPQTRVAPLGIISMAGTSELGHKIDSYMVGGTKNGGYDKDTFLVE